MSMKANEDEMDYLSQRANIADRAHCDNTSYEDWIELVKESGRNLKVKNWDVDANDDWVHESYKCGCSAWNYWDKEEDF